MYDTSLCFLTATELGQKIRSGEISAVETMEAHLAQIEKVNPQVNAIVTLLPELDWNKPVRRMKNWPKAESSVRCMDCR